MLESNAPKSRTLVWRLAVLGERGTEYGIPCVYVASSFLMKVRVPLFASDTGRREHSRRGRGRPVRGRQVHGAVDIDLGEHVQITCNVYIYIYIYIIIITIIMIIIIISYTYVYVS